MTDRGGRAAVQPPPDSVERPTALWVAFAAAQGLVVAALLNWVTISDDRDDSSHRGIDGLIGWLTCLVGLASLILLLAAMDRPQRRRQICAVVTALGAVAVVFAFARYVQIQDEVSAARDRPLDDGSMGLGIVATLASAVVLAVSGFRLLRRWKPDVESTASVGA